MPTIEAKPMTDILERLRIREMSVGDKEPLYGLAAAHIAAQDARIAVLEVALLPVAQWKHKARGSEYLEYGYAELQDAKGDGVEEGALLVIYRSDCGKFWARRVREFQDGRFEKLATLGGEQHGG